MTEPSCRAEPDIEIAPAGFTNIDAQEWVRDHGKPMLVLDGGAVFTLVFRASDGYVKLDPYWGVSNLEQALAAAHGTISREA